MPFKIENDNVLVKYNEISNRIKKNAKHEILQKPVYDEKYIKAKVKTFNSVVNTVFLDYEIPKESIRYICIAEVSIDSVMKIDKKLTSSSSRRIQI